MWQVLSVFSFDQVLPNITEKGFVTHNYNLPPEYNQDTLESLMATDTHHTLDIM